MWWSVVAATALIALGSTDVSAESGEPQTLVELAQLRELAMMMMRECLKQARYAFCDGSLAFCVPWENRDFC